MKSALITGNGQDSNYLAKLLLEKDYKVIIATRRSGSNSGWRAKALKIDHDLNLSYECLDITDVSNVQRIIKKYKPDELYHLAAQSFVASSFDIPLSTFTVNAVGTLYLLEAIREYSPHTKIYNASTSEMLGGLSEKSADENTAFHPRSPYGVAKLAAHWAVINYRESYSMFACSGILHNHESPLRGEEFVTRKISKGFADIIKGDIKKISLGNLYAKRDWGYAKDYCEAMWLMLQNTFPTEYIIATNTTHTIKDFVNECAVYHNLNGEWIGKDVEEKYVVNGKIFVDIDPKFYRPAEVNHLLGCPDKAKRELEWEPKVHFEELVHKMCDYDMTGIIRE
jgi:GDPmannose 4,6-dehydratase